MVFTQAQMLVLNNYFRYCYFDRKIKSSIKIIIALLIYLFFAVYIFWFSNSKMSRLQIVLYGVGSVLSLVYLVSEIISVVRLLIGRSHKNLKYNLIIEDGRIKHIDLNRVETRVIVTDDVGDPYIAKYADEFVDTLYKDDLPIEIHGCLLYLKGRKKESLVAYPFDYLELYS